ncbi:hypothetical protein HZS_1445 [Henneguya salminicola]|nr:hypothetical protein HZS_1445 [Henneguya salminicola]
MQNNIKNTSTPASRINLENIPEYTSWPVLSSYGNGVGYASSENNGNPTISQNSIPIDVLSHSITPTLMNFQTTGTFTNCFMNSFPSNLDTASGFNSPGSFSDNFAMVSSNLVQNQIDDCGSLNSINLNKNIDFNMPFTVNNDIPTKNLSMLNKNQFSQLIQETIAGLNSKNINEITKFSIQIYKILKNANSLILASEAEKLASILVKCAWENNSNEPIFRACSAAIYYLASIKAYAHFLFKSNFFELFPMMLEYQTNALIFYLISTTHTIFLMIPDSRNFLSSTCNLGNFLSLLNNENDRLLAILIDSLTLCFNSLDTNFMLYNTQFLTNIVNILKTKTYEKLVFNSCRLLKEISVHTPLKPVVVKSGTIQLLTKYLLHISRRIAVISLITIRNLSDVAAIQPNQEELIDILIRFVVNQLCAANQRNENKKIEEQLVASSLGILANITCNNQCNKELLVSRGFVVTLINVCNVLKGKEIVEAAASTLRHITCRHSKCEEACKQFVKSKGLLMAINILNINTPLSIANSSNLKKVFFGLITNFASKPQYLAQIRDLKVTQLAAHTLAAVMDEIIKNNSYNGCPPGVRISSWKFHLLNCNKLLEVCVIILYLISDDNCSLKLMISSHILMSLFAKLLLQTHGTTLAYVISFLSRVSEDSSGLAVIEKTFSSFQNEENACLNSTSTNVYIDRLTKIYANYKSSSNNSEPLSSLMANLSKTTLIRDHQYINAEIFSNMLGQFDGDHMETSSQNYCYNDFNGLIDSPIMVCNCSLYF